MDDNQKKLSILIDGYNMGLEKGTGVATYGRNLSRIVKLSGHHVDVLYGKKSTRAKDPLLSEVAFFDAAKPKPKGVFSPIKNFKDVVATQLACRIDTVPISGRVVIDALESRLPKFDRLLNSPELFLRSHRAFSWFGRFTQLNLPGLDLAHWTYPLPLRIRNTINIYTLHDLVPLRLPHTTLDNKRRYLKMCKIIADSADHIVTVSETSRRDIINLLDVPPDKVSNTFQSVSFSPQLLAKTPTIIRDELAGLFNLPYKNYFLYFGAIEPKKNLGRLIEAYLVSSVTTPLVIVGAPGWGSEEELKFLKSISAIRSAENTNAARNRIFFLEYLPQSMLISMIRGAKATLFPSLYEGFGLPVLESMFLGTAVITSNISSLPEVAGDAACLINPYDTRQIAEAIREIDCNEDLRLNLENKGLKQATLFSEAAYAQRLHEVYSSVHLK